MQTSEGIAMKRAWLRPGAGIAVARLLLPVAEPLLHSDAVRYRFRTAFAAGWAMDKPLHAESNPPRLLLLRNSRVDIGFDPATVIEHPGGSAGPSVFNLRLADPAVLTSVRAYEVVGVLATVALVLVEPRVVAVLERRGVDWWWQVPFPLRGVAYASLVLAIVVFGGPTQKFIYFDF